MSKHNCPLSAGALVFGYARDSGGDRQDLSVKQQVRELSLYCERHGLVLVHVFRDEARQAGTVVGREAFDDLVHLARQEPRRVDGIVVWSFSRFARNLLDAQFFKADLRRRGYEVISFTDDLPDGAHAPLIEAVIDWKNEQFRKDLSRDVKRGLRDLVRQGFAPGGRPPVGYKVERVEIGRRRDGSKHVVSRWVPDPAKAELVRKAWRMRAEGASYAEIDEATHLYGSKGSYASMFDNETYRGVLKCGDLRIEGRLEALVDEETWAAVQARRSAYARRLRSDREHPKRRSSPYLLSGLAVCGHCGAAMACGTDNVARGCPWPYYLCGRKKREGWGSCPTGRVNGRLLDEVVLDMVIGRVLTPDYVMAIVKDVNATLALDDAGIEHQVRELRREVARVEKAIENLVDLAERFGADAAGTRLLAREAEREALTRRLEGLKRRQELRRVQVDPEVVEAVLARMRGTLEGGDLQAKRALLKRFVERVEVVSKEMARLVYTFPIAETVYNVAVPWGYSGTCRKPHPTAGGVSAFETCSFKSVWLLLENGEDAAKPTIVEPVAGGQAFAPRAAGLRAGEEPWFDRSFLMIYNEIALPASARQADHVTAAFPPSVPGFCLNIWQMVLSSLWR